MHKNESLIIICFNWKAKAKIVMTINFFFWFNSNWPKLCLRFGKLICALIYARYGVVLLVSRMTFGENFVCLKSICVFGIDMI